MCYTTITLLTRNYNFMNTDYDPKLPLKYDYFGDTTEILHYIELHKLHDFLLCFYDNVLLYGYDIWHITIELDTKLILTIYTGATFDDSAIGDIIEQLVPVELLDSIRVETTRD